MKISYFGTCCAWGSSLHPKCHDYSLLQCMVAEVSAKGILSPSVDRQLLRRYFLRKLSLKALWTRERTLWSSTGMPWPSLLVFGIVQTVLFLTRSHVALPVIIPHTRMCKCKMSPFLSFSNFHALSSNLAPLMFRLCETLQAKKDHQKNLLLAAGAFKTLLYVGRNSGNSMAALSNWIVNTNTFQRNTFPTQLCFLCHILKKYEYWRSEESSTKYHSAANRESEISNSKIYLSPIIFETYEPGLVHCFRMEQTAKYFYWR